MVPDVIRVAGIVGSLRSGSYNRKLLDAAIELAPDDLRIESVDLRGVPFYDADVEQRGDPEAVTTLKRSIRDADAVLIVTPEYQHSLPGVLKNALDWASRPPSDPPLRRKPTAVMGATVGRFGTARAQAELRKVLAYNDALVLQRPEVMVPNAKSAFDDDGALIDEDARGFVRQLLVNLSAWTRTVSDWRPPEAA
jgi:chromate reductase, NAD(P)H dehydrogenase (quinone)